MDSPIPISSATRPHDPNHVDLPEGYRFRFSPDPTGIGGRIYLEEMRVKKSLFGKRKQVWVQVHSRGTYMDFFSYDKKMCWISYKKKIETIRKAKEEGVVFD